MNELLQWIATGIIVALAAVMAVRAMCRRKKGGCGCHGNGCGCGSASCSGCPLDRDCTEKTPRK